MVDTVYRALFIFLALLPLHPIHAHEKKPPSQVIVLSSSSCSSRTRFFLFKGADCTRELASSVRTRVCVVIGEYG